MKNLILKQAKKCLTLLSLLVLLQLNGNAQTDPTAQSLPYSQDFSSLTGSTTTYPAGFQGWTITGSLSNSAATNAPNGDQAMAAGTNATTTAGVYDMNGKMGLVASASNIRAICLAVKTTSLTNISVTWDAATQSQRNGGRVDLISLQYRVGTSGSFTNISNSSYRNNASSDISSGTSASNASTISIVLPSACEDQSAVELRWVIRDTTGSGNRPSFSIDNIVVKSTTTPTITKSSPNQISSGTIYQGAINQVLSNFQLATSSSYGSLTSLAFKTKGTYTTASDITNFKLWYNSSSNTLGGSTQIGTTQPGVTSGSTVTFSSLTTVIPVSSTGYFWISTTLPANATATSTLYTDTAYTLTFTLSSQTGSISAGGAQTITTALPVITLANGTISSGNITQNTTNNVLYRIDVTVATTSATLNTVNFTTAGNYSSSDITNLKLWYSTSTTFSTATATNISTLTASLGAGSQSFASLSQAFSIGTAYLYITTDIPCAATAAKAINVSAISASSLVFASGTPSGSSFTAGGSLTFIATTPVNATAAAALGNGITGQISVSWTNPTGCFNEVMIVAAPATNTAAPAANNGSGYTANLAYGSGTSIGNGFVIYKGSTSPQIITGLTNGTTYSFKIYTRWDTAWTSGTADVNSSSYKQPVLTEIYLPQYMQGTSGTNTNRIPYVYRVKIDSLRPYATYRYINQVVIASDAATISGAGNAIFVDSTNGFTRSAAVSLTNAGNYGTFTSNAVGSFTGWFITEPTGNVTRFVPGNKVYMNVILNDGNGGTSAQSYIRTPDSVVVLDLKTTQTSIDGSGLYGVSHATAKNLVMIYDNENGTGRPISSCFVESDGTANTTANSYASFYNSNVEATSSAWGTIIPNSGLSNGIRRVEFIDSTGNSVYAVTSSNGVWNANNTVNPNAGTTAVKIPRTGCDKLIVNKNITLNSSLNVSSTITLNAGTLAVGANTLTDTGTLTRISGNIDVSTGKIVFLNSSPLNIPNSTFTGSIAKLSVSGTAGITLPSSLNVTDTLTNTDTISGTIIMSGSSAQKIIGTGVITSLTINNSSGVTLASGYNQTITGTLTCSTGLLNTSTGSSDGIILDSSATISESNSSNIVGRLFTSRKVLQNTLNTFGGLGLNITESTQSSNTYAVTRVTGTPISSGNTGAFTGNQGIKRYYTITPTVNSGLSAQVKFFYRDGELNGITEGNLRIYTHPDPYTNGSWADLGNRVIVNTSTNTIINDPKHPVTHFSTWSFSSNASPLPVELVSLKGNMQNGSAVINWIASNEDLNSTYQIKHGNDIYNTNLIGSQAALANGESAAYELIHNSPNIGTNYYQLWATQASGSTKMLGQIAVENKGDNHTVNMPIQLFPNPANNNLNILLGSITTTSSKIKITDMTGSVIMEQRTSGKNMLNLDVAHLPTGMYHIAIYGSGGELLQEQRFVKN